VLVPVAAVETCGGWIAGSAAPAILHERHPNFRLALPFTVTDEP